MGSLSVTVTTSPVSPHDRGMMQATLAQVRFCSKLPPVVTPLRHCPVRALGDIHNRYCWSQSGISVFRQNYLLSRRCYLPRDMLSRLLTDGTISPEPAKTTRFGMMKVCLTVSLGLYLGAAISWKMAAWLEENELFTVQDEDD